MKARYRELTVTLLVAGLGLCAYRAVFHFIKFFQEAGNYLYGRSYISQQYSGGLVPYLESAAMPDPFAMVWQLTAFLGMGMFAAAFLVVIIKGTKNRILPVIFCMVGLSSLIGAVMENIGLYLFVVSEPASLMLILLQAAVIIALMAYVPRINSKQRLVICLCAAFAVLTVVCTVLKIDTNPILNALAAAAGIIGFALAVGEDCSEEEDEEECGEEQDKTA